jgi:hypothetical protein
VSQWRVELPRQVQRPFEVYVNGVRQQEGSDFQLRGRALLFDRPLAREGRLGPWRWFLGAWGIGTYRKNDVIDVRYERDGQMLVAHALEITPPPERPPEREPDAPTDKGA